MKNYITGIFGLLFCYSVGAQSLGFSTTGLSASSNRLEAKFMGKVFYINAFVNTYFLYPKDWVEGDVVFENGDKYENRKLRYHAKSNELIAYNENTSGLFEVEKAQVDYFTLAMDGIEKKYVKLYPKGEEKDGKYYQELYSGTQKLLALLFIYEHKVSPYTDDLGIMRDVEFDLRTDYYRYSGKDGLQKMGLRRRALLHAFPEHKRELKKLLREFRISPTTPEAMAKIYKLMDERGMLH